jgi:hypothetical protein
MKMNALKFAAVLVMPLSFAVAEAQTSGVSHPDETDIVTSSEGVSQLQAYQPTPAAVTPALALHTHTPEVNIVEPVRPLQASAEDSDSARNAYEAAAMENARSIPNADGQIVTRMPGPSNQLPVGTLINVRLREALHTETTVQGSTFSAALTEPVLRDGVVLLPAGSVISGRVTEVHGGRRISGPAAIHLQTDFVTLPDGTRYPIRGQVMDTATYNHTKVDSEGTILRRDHAKATVAELGLATGAGAAAGAIIGGVPGALIGGAVGAGLGTTVWLKQDRQASLPAQTLITFSLNQPLTVGGR